MSTQASSGRPLPLPRQPRQGRPPWVVGLILSGAVILVIGLGAFGFFAGLWVSFRNLPDVQSLDRYTPSQRTQIYDIKGRLIADVRGEANRTVVPLSGISTNLKNAVIAIEDDQFYKHNGIRYDTIIRAAIANFQEGRAAQGGSTLTQQLAKNLFLTPKKSLNRKIAEAFLAWDLERNFTKDQILKMYFNQVYWGHNNYGAETAARTYFGKSASQLNVAEGAMMAGLLRAPEYYSPLHSVPHAKERQAVVLDRMVELKLITPAQAASAKKQPLKYGYVHHANLVNIPYVSSFVLKELERQFGEEALRQGGFKVQTTLDMNLQKIAESSVKADVAYLRRQRVRQMALVSLDPRTGFIKALVGGADFKKSQFNRATQSRRQPGSSFKPFVYYTAFAEGRITPDSIVVDAPVRFGSYSPHNYDNTFGGAMTVRKAVQFSRNVPAVKIGRAVGIRNVINTCRILGMKADWQPNLAVALGSVDVSPLEMAGAYASFANGGFGVKPTVLLQVTDREDNVLYRYNPERPLVLDPKAVDMVNDVLQAVVTGGTGKKAQLGRPVAGKTGTTSDFRDAWFVGYVPQMVTAIWIGNDDYSRMASGTAGGAFVAPLWRQYMVKALAGQAALPFPTQYRSTFGAVTSATKSSISSSNADQPPRSKHRGSKDQTTNTALLVDPANAPKSRHRRRRHSDISTDLTGNPVVDSMTSTMTPPKRHRPRHRPSDTTAAVPPSGQ